MVEENEAKREDRKEQGSRFPLTQNAWLWAAGSVVVSALAIGVSIALTAQWRDLTLSLMERLARSCGVSLLVGCVGFAVAIVVAHFFARTMEGKGPPSHTAASIANPLLVLLAIPDRRVAGVGGMAYVIVSIVLMARAHGFGPARAMGAVVGGLSVMIVLLLTLAGSAVQQ